MLVGCRFKPEEAERGLKREIEGARDGKAWKERKRKREGERK